MAEAAGLGLAVVSLTFQIFSGCVKGYELLSDARGMPKEYQYLRVRIKTEQYRLLDWANVAQLSERDDQMVLGNANRSLLVDVLDQQQRLLMRFGRYDDKLKPLRKPLVSDDTDFYGTDADTHGPSDNPPEYSSRATTVQVQRAESFQSRFPQSETLLKKSLILMDKAGLFPKKLKWAAWEKEKVEALIMRLSALNDYMKELLNTRQLELLLSRQMRTDYQIMQLNNKLDHLVQIFEAAKVLSMGNTQPRAPASPSDAYLQARGLDGVFDEVKKVTGAKHLATLAKFKALNSAVDTGGMDDKTAQELELGHSMREVTAVELNRNSIELIDARDDPPDRSRVEAYYQHPLFKNKQQVWIEWKPYEPVASHGGPEPKVLERVQALTALLRENNHTDQFRAPHCVGYFRDGDGVEEDHYQFGMVFEKPAGVDPAARPVSLLELLCDSTREIPSLTERIALAAAIAECLEKLHAVNWLHKGLRSHNIIFFPSSPPSSAGAGNGEDGKESDKKADEARLDLSQPYVSGFDYSRPAQNEDLTERPPDNAADDLYRHPRAQGSSPRDSSFQKSFDIYSLGIILLEIAYWKPIDVLLGLTEPKSLRPAVTVKVRQRLLEEKPVLGHVKSHLGNTFEELVRACIEGPAAFGISETEDEKTEEVGAKLQNEFYVRVVDKLGSIRV